MMLIEQTSVAASALPIAQFREHLRLGTGFSDAGLQDDLLETCLRSAISAIEARIGKALIEKRYLQSVSAWRDGDWHPISVAPVVDVVSVSIVDRSDATSVVGSDKYRVRRDNAVPLLMGNNALPTIPSGGTAEIVFTAGFGADWTGLPDDLLRAIYVLATEYYENRDGRERRWPNGVNQLIERYRPVRISSGGV